MSDKQHTCQPPHFPTVHPANTVVGHGLSHAGLSVELVRLASHIGQLFKRTLLVEEYVQATPCFVAHAIQCISSRTIRVGSMEAGGVCMCRVPGGVCTHAMSCTSNRPCMSGAIVYLWPM